MLYRACTLVALSLLSTQSAALQVGCVSRLTASRVVSQPARAAVYLCDAPADEAEAPAAVAEDAPAAAAEAPAAAKGSKTPLEQLEVGAEVEGKIKSVMSYGAFVDIGASTDGLLHVSEISNEFVKDATEKLSVGESITCKVKAVNLEKSQLALTCKEPRAGGGAPRARKPKVDLTEFESADPKEFITGKVNTITDFGAFVTIKEGVDGLVHISQIQDGGVGKVEEVLSVGQEVQVRVTSVDKSKRRIGLSMRAWVEGGDEEKGGRRRGGGGGGFGGDMGFGEADLPFRMNAEELEGLTASDEFLSPFDTAFDRAAQVSAKKAAKERYAPAVL
eukprot:CAMPEP_0115848768 /NCGR_PEP_ID=MMETSP0287-20121206/11098_1 /TAXON_ID=412157 /ORGANISM="Chrysochromulina rotalis, Strain UIO044" /LENGTH=332 /DNA_ID=CAMNT_0003302703 /DNA_START=34 /DNA_END=1032 /DNA_ORIENTATION=+